MNRYSVYIEFIGGKDFQFETNTNPMTIKPIFVNGAEMIITEDQYGINKKNVVRMEVVEIGKGKIGEYMKQ